MQGEHMVFDVLSSFIYQVEINLLKFGSLWQFIDSGGGSNDAGKRHGIDQFASGIQVKYHPCALVLFFSTVSWLFICLFLLWGYGFFSLVLLAC